MMPYYYNYYNFDNFRYIDDNFHLFEIDYLYYIVNKNWKKIIVISFLIDSMKHAGLKIYK